PNSGCARAPNPYSGPSPAPPTPGSSGSGWSIRPTRSGRGRRSDAERAGRRGGRAAGTRARPADHADLTAVAGVAEHLVTRPRDRQLLIRRHHEYGHPACRRGDDPFAGTALLGLRFKLHEPTLERVQGAGHKPRNVLAASDWVGALSVH